MKQNTRPVVLTIGIFDGVHLGHRKLLKKVVELSRSSGCESAVLTFDRSPRGVNGLLTTTEEKTGIMSSLGINRIETIRFDGRFREVPPESFFKTLAGRYSIRQLVVGHDFRFGRNRAGGRKLLEKLCGENRIRLVKVKPFKFCDRIEGRKTIVSSSRIRSLVEKGRLETAGELLCGPYSIEGAVVKGRGIGRKLGFPTANLSVDRRKLLPAGVFVVQACVGENVYSGIANVGFRPTFRRGRPRGRAACEVHCFDFDGNLAGRKMRVSLYKMLRKEKKFDSVESLKRQICMDISRAKGGRCFNGQE